MPLTRNVRRSKKIRLAATALAVFGQLLIGSPLLAADAAQAVTQAAIKTATSAERALAKKRITVNRTVPTVTAPVLTTAFGADVSADAVRRAAIFGEPLLPVGTPSPDQNRAIAELLSSLVGTDMPHRLLRIEQFLASNPTSPWEPSLLANAGTLFARNGYFSRATAYWDHAWELTQASLEPNARAIADYALGESMSQMVMFGQVPRLEQRLKEVEGRDVRGAGGAKVTAAASGLLVLRDHHELALFSGPEALKALLRTTTSISEDVIRRINEYHPTPAGTSLVDLRTLAASSGLALRMVHSAPVTDIPIPSIVHFRSQHFSAVTAKEGDAYVLRDPAFGGTFRMTEAALRDESSGYFLVPDKDETSRGWRTVPIGEAEGVVGHCTPGPPSPHDPPCPNCGGPGPGPSGMPQYKFLPVNAALILEDVPLGYAPPVGPPVSLQLSYNHKDARQPQTPNYGNVGPLWTFNALSYVTDHPYCIIGPCPAAVVYLRGLGQEGYSALSSPHPLSLATLTQVTNDPPRYERALSDGTVEVFTQPDRPASEYSRRVLLTQVVDPQGRTLTYTYDSSLRLVAITDAIGQVTTLEYTNASNPLLLTKVTDPFGRFATIGYDSAGRIQSITDVANMTSTFVYGANDFVAAMTTPYGTTTFRHEARPSWEPPAIDATDPVGGREHLEFRFQDDALPSTEASNLVPTGFSASNVDLHKYNTLYWDKVAMAQAPLDRAAAVITNWMWFTDAVEFHAASHNVPHSIKRPLERRIWYRYAGQTGIRSMPPTGREPALIGRVLDDGTSQVTQVTFNSKGLVTSRIDPLGRQTNYTYASNGIDLLTVEQVRSGGTDVLQTYADYTNHLPQTITDASGNDTTMTYNAAGQPLTVTNAKNETTTYTYESGTNNLLTVTGPVSGATTTYSYDAYGRVESVEDADGYVVVTDYDNLNRVTQRTYPDDTTETFTYNRLDLTEQKDRLGRITRHFYDGFGRRIATRDPAARTVSQIWCDCGALEALVDANGQRTRWERDVQGRVTREVRADNTTDTLYTYDLAGRLKTITDPKDQVTTRSYNVDDSLSGTAYTNEEHETPDVSYTYDPYYGRVATMVDGIGTTTYGYVAPGTNGAGQVASVDGPLSNDTIAYTYDELGRVTRRTINGSANQVDWTFDALGRVTSETNVLGAFDYTYDGVTSRLATVTYPNDQTSTYSYYNNAGDRRLQTIHHKYPDTSTLSKFDYTYDAVGNILTWRQQADTTAVTWAYGYDPADQLTAAVKNSTSTPATILQRYAYAYDPAGNRTIEQIDDTVTLSAYDNLNRLTSQAPGGPMVIAGALNEPGTVTISGAPAVVDGSNTFRGTVPTVTGTNTFTIVAKDAAGNTTTQQYEVDVAGTGKTFAYDANGNLISDGTRTFEWDSRNQIVAVTVATHRSEFTYDGEQRRVRTVEKEDGTTQSDTKVVWCDGQICEERAADGATVARRAYGAGEEIAGVGRFFAADHLGSVDALLDNSGTVITRYSFDPWGRRTIAQGQLSTERGFAGQMWQDASQLSLTRYRAFDPELGRWLSEDPLVTRQATPDRLLFMPNHFRYARNNPVRWFDRTGLIAWTCHVVLMSIGSPAGAASIGADCTSDCGVGGRKLRQRLAGIGAQANFGPMAWSATGSTYRLVDPFPAPNPWSLPGFWQYYGAGVGFWSYSQLRIGMAKSELGYGNQIGVDAGGIDAMSGATVKVAPDEWIPCGSTC